MFTHLFGNVYLNPLDHYVTEVLRAPYLRYLDDFALFADDRQTLTDWRTSIAAFLERRRLLLHPRKTRILQATSPALFLGYILGPGRRRRLPEDNVERLRLRLRSLRDRWSAGTVEVPEVRQRLGAWIAHARHADSEGLLLLTDDGALQARRIKRHQCTIEAKITGNGKRCWKLFRFLIEHLPQPCVEILRMTIQLLVAREIQQLRNDIVTADDALVDTVNLGVNIKTFAPDFAVQQKC